MMIEQNTSYAYKLKYIKNPSFDKIRGLTKFFINDLPKELVDKLYEELDRGIDILDSEPHMLAYLYSYGIMHQAKLNYAFNNLPDEFLKHPAINIIDYGCGQALGTMCYADFLHDNGYTQKIKAITLIEPSELCLKRAALHASVFLPDAEIITVNRTFDELDENDICCDEGTPTLHILSNVLDMLSFDLDKLAKLVKCCLKGYNQFVCVGPYFNNANKDNRIMQFCSLIQGQDNFFKTLNKYELNTDKAWTAQISIFKTDILKKRYTAIDFEQNQLLAEHGDANAQYTLGRFYCEDKDNKIEAFKWFRKAANQDHDDALICLGCCFQRGYGISKDYNKALELYLRSASFNNYRAQASLGNCYYSGIGVSVDYQKAFEWYEKAAKQGNSDAQYMLSQCYYYGKGINKDYNKAVEWCAKAATQGDSDAQFMLGDCYYWGKGINLDYLKAVEWYEKAAKQGHSSAQYNLGVCYYNGVGINKDYKKAVEWFEKAALKNHAFAQYSLGLCYKNGYGVPSDRVKAIGWFELAAKQGHKKAIEALRMYK